MFEILGNIFLLGLGTTIVLIVVTLMLCGGAISALCDFMHSRFGWFDSQYSRGHKYEDIKRARYRYRKTLGKD